MRLTPNDIKQIQNKLNMRGFGPLEVDGVRGRSTNNAIVAFKVSVGLKARDYFGPVTWKALFLPTAGISAPARINSPDIPWFDELMRKKGLHEVRDKTVLMRWLSLAGGNTIGDPAKTPWCGDAVETPIAITLPNEPLPTNPFLAANWAKWGRYVDPQLGCIMSFWRGSPDSWKGHVALYFGESKTAYRILGGNQSNAITLTWIAKDRLRKHGSRWPVTAMAPKGIKRWLSSTGEILSTDEA